MEILTKAEFLSNSKHHNGVVLFHIADQAQSKQMATTLEILRADHTFDYFKVPLDGRIAEVRMDWEPLKITTLPLVVLFQNQVEVGRVEGANPPELVALVERLSNPQLQAEKLDSSTALQKRLQALVNSAPIIIFMKGSKHEPFCRFSKQAVSILNQLNVDFSSFDVFTDQSVREGMKEFSQWPTFPQLYINGEFIGGVDIMKEMFISGELKTLLEKFRPTDLNERLQTLINRAPVVVFMKGERHHPLCRFSHQLMDLFTEAGVTDFDTFNILEDNEVREGLKVYSDWPTYPQIYVNGQLLGGVDIVKEMLDTGGRQALLEEIQGMMKSH